jgi:hypothetical protein
VRSWAAEVLGTALTLARSSRSVTFAIVCHCSHSPVREQPGAYGKVPWCPRCREARRKQKSPAQGAGDSADTKGADRSVPKRGVVVAVHALIVGPVGPVPVRRLPIKETVSRRSSTVVAIWVSVQSKRSIKQFAIDPMVPERVLTPWSKNKIKPRGDAFWPNRLTIKRQSTFAKGCRRANSTGHPSRSAKARDDGLGERHAPFDRARGRRPQISHADRPRGFPRVRYVVAHLDQAFNRHLSRSPTPPFVKKFGIVRHEPSAPCFIVDEAPDRQVEDTHAEGGDDRSL